MKLDDGMMLRAKKGKDHKDVSERLKNNVLGADCINITCEYIDADAENLFGETNMIGPAEIMQLVKACSQQIRIALGECKRDQYDCSLEPKALYDSDRIPVWSAFDVLNCIARWRDCAKNNNNFMAGATR